VGLALQTRAAGFGSGRRRGGLQSPSGSLRVADPSGAAVAVRARGSKPVAPLRAKKSFGGTAPSSPLCFFYITHILWSDWRDSAFFLSSLSFFFSLRLLRIRFALMESMLLGHVWIRHIC
jgi:shikimate kinase